MSEDIAFLQISPKSSIFDSCVAARSRREIVTMAGIVPAGNLAVADPRLSADADNIGTRRDSLVKNTTAHAPPDAHGTRATAFDPLMCNRCADCAKDTIPSIWTRASPSRHTISTPIERVRPKSTLLLRALSSRCRKCWWGRKCPKKNSPFRSIPMPFQRRTSNTPSPPQAMAQIALQAKIASG